VKLIGLFLVAFMLSGCSDKKQEHKTKIIKARVMFWSRGAIYRGAVFEYKGKEYILNREGGVLEIK